MKLPLAFALLLAVAWPSASGDLNPFDHLSRRAEEEKAEAAAPRIDRERLRRQTERLENFAQAWNSFADEFQRNRAYNVKKARAVRRAWTELEKESFWPKE